MMNYMTIVSLSISLENAYLPQSYFWY